MGTHPICYSLLRTITQYVIFIPICYSLQTQYVIVNHPKRYSESPNMLSRITQYVEVITHYVMSIRVRH